MKKLFSYLMVAAAALVVACGPAEEDPQNKPEKNFYGFNMDNADIADLGNDQYLIQMYNNNEEGYTVRLVSLLVTIPGVTEGILPAGSYKVAEGEVGDNKNYFTGSFYQNDIAATPYIILFDKGELEVKHTADGYCLTLWNGGGFNAETGDAMNNLEIRYEGNAELYGTYNPTKQNTGYAIYIGQFTETAYCWVFEVDIDTTEAVLYYDFYLLVEDDNFEAGIPSGKYPMLMTGEAGTALPTFVSGGQYAGSMLLEYIESEGDSNIVDLVRGGEINVVNNGDGTYEIDVDYYNYFNIPYSTDYSGAVQHLDKSQAQGGGGAQGGENQVLAMYWGGPNWVFYLADATNQFIAYLDTYNGNMAGSFADGLKAGTYTYTDDTTNFNMSIWAPIMEGEQWTSTGSVILSLSGQSILDIVTDATMEVVANEDGTYAITANIEGTQLKDYTFEFNGEVMLEDGTAAQVSAKAPLKVAAKFDNTKNVKFNKNVTSRGFRK